MKVEVVTSFTFLGSEAEKEGSCDKEKMNCCDRKSDNDWTIKAMARQTGEHRNEKSIVRSLIFPTALHVYDCETWTMTK